MTTSRWLSPLAIHRDIHTPWPDGRSYRRVLRSTCLLPSTRCIARRRQTCTSGLVLRLDAFSLSVIATATWLGGWLSVTAGILSIRLNLSENVLDHLVGPSFKHLATLTAIPNSTGNPISGGVKYTGGGGKIGDFRVIFDGYRRLSRKRCEIGRWLLWNVNRKSWVPDWMV